MLSGLDVVLVEIRVEICKAKTISNLASKCSVRGQILKCKISHVYHPLF